MSIGGGLYITGEPYSLHILITVIYFIQSAGVQRKGDGSMRIFVKPYDAGSLAGTVISALTGVSTRVVGVSEVGATFEFNRCPELTEAEVRQLLTAIRADGTHVEVV